MSEKKYLINANRIVGHDGKKYDSVWGDCANPIPDKESEWISVTGEHGTMWIEKDRVTSIVECPERPVVPAKPAVPHDRFDWENNYSQIYFL